MAEKTEQPTRGRLRRARAEGDSPISAPLVSAVGLVALLAVAPWALESLASTARQWLERALDPNRTPVSPAAALEDTARWLAACIATAAIPAVVAGLVQTHGVVRFPVRAGARGRAAEQRAFDGLRGTAISIGVIGVTALVLWVHRVDLARIAGRLDAALHLGEILGWRTVRLAAALILGAAALDTVASHVFWVRRHRMSRHERRLEARQSEGDPEIRRRRRAAHEALANSPPAITVAWATVIVTAGDMLAVALRYDPSEPAPRPIDTGHGARARELIFAAERAGIPRVEHPELARALAAGPAGEPIAPAQYDAVAGVLARL